MNELSGALRLQWEEIGPALLDASGKVQFPKLPSKPGLYSFRVVGRESGCGFYVGETDNLQRPFAHYRNPGPTQSTNIRLNALCRQAITEGGAVLIAVVIERAWLASGSGAEIQADFNRKSIRRLFENFVLSAERAIEVQDLNR